MSTTQSSSDIYAEFQRQVNMTAAELKQWLSTEESKSVGQDDGDGESVGHKSGKHILQILAKKKSELTSADEAHMHKVHAYISRHLAQGPATDKEHSRWRYSLMNWGHDPLKKS
ncbi:DUF3140 domain-containing protein [Hymenobacter metallicola]|uniref:DUF3140 domain-containing protein n=1 Tax=Hymenobacter metallicola TaxID=2563114 RepID=A0A4Z0Q9I1_9BACT|nr:DUF3140 domain-containing protein [Hymenobacter metallicola]TGE26738.1 DUF3140 domain-containing protein [Hymenobacter metallicola]